MDSNIKERWFELTLIEQMINIGNEVKRGFRFDNNVERRNSFLDKAIQYTELSIADPKNKRVIPELKIGKEVLEDYTKDHYLNCSKEEINRYYQNFQLLV